MSTETPAQEEKHMSIVHATDRLNGVRKNALRLFERITGVPSVKKEEPDHTASSLKQVLDSSGNKIFSIAEEINEFISNIEDELF